MPSIDLLLPDSTTHFETAKIAAGQPVVLFYFSPFCPYCRAELQELIDHNEALGRIEVVLITDYGPADILPFYSRYKLARFPNMVMGGDIRHVFAAYFKTNQVPYLAVYNGKGMLQQVAIGQLGSEEIKDIASR